MANLQKRHHVRSQCHESHESSLPGFRKRLPDQPAIEAREVEGSRSENVLQMHVGLTSVACLAQATSPDTLRKRAFNSCSSVGERLELLRRLSLAASLQRLRASLWASCQGSARRGRLCLCTPLPMGAGTTILYGECDGDHRVASPILDVCPTAPRLALWAGRTLLLPIHHNLRGRKPRALTRLPLGSVPGWSTEIDLIVLLTLDDCFRVHRARVHDVPLWEEIVVLESFVDGWNSSKVGQGCRSRFDRGNQVWAVVIAGFGQMDFVARPTCVALFRIMRLGIIWRVDTGARRGHIGCLSPAQFSILPKELLDPDSAQRLHGGNFLQPCRGRGGVDGIQEVVAIPPTHESLCLACLLPVREPVIFDSVCVSVSPVLLHLPGEPLRSRYGPRVQGRPKGFPYRFHAIERADLREHMGRVTPLAPACFDIAPFPQPCEQQIKDPLLLVPSHQALPKLDQPTVIKARIIECSSQQIFPIQASTHRICCLPIGEAL